MARRDMRWFGWGDPAHVSHGLPDGALELLRARVGLSDMPRPPFPLSAIRLPAPVEFDIPGVQLRTDDEARILHAGGKSYPDLVRMRSGALEAAPDAVAVPRTEHEVRAAHRDESDPELPRSLALAADNPHQLAIRREHLDPGRLPVRDIDPARVVHRDTSRLAQLGGSPVLALEAPLPHQARAGGIGPRRRAGAHDPHDSAGEGVGDRARQGGGPGAAA